MRVFVLDPGLVSLVGHHVAVNQLLHERLADSQVVVLGNRALPFSARGWFACRPTFTHSPYAPWPDHPLGPLDLITSSNLAAEKELARAIPDPRPDDLIITHTLSATFAHGLARWLEAAGPRAPRVRAVLRFPPSFPSGEGELMGAIWARALRALSESARDVRLFADSVGLQRVFASLTGLQIGRVPLAVDLRHMDGLPPTDPTATGGLRWGFFGAGRPEKGTALLAEAFMRHRAARPQDTFVVQAVAAPPPVVRRLLSLGGAMHFIDRSRHGADWAALIASVDVVLVPYDPVAYDGRTSHILVEALAAGRAVVTVAGTTMAHELSDVGFRVGALAEAFSARAIGAAMADVVEHRRDALEGAAFVAPMMRRKHGAEAFLDVLLR